MQQHLEGEKAKEGGEITATSESLLGRVQSLHTHVCFYLAQAYAATRRPHESAHYCLLTLEKQINETDNPSSKFDPFEWYKNCAGLVDYYTGHDRYRDAEYCLNACDRVLDTKVVVPAPPAPAQDIMHVNEKLNEARADMQRRWGVYYLNILQDASQAHASGDLSSLPTTDTLNVNFSRGLEGLPTPSSVLPYQLTSFEAVCVCCCAVVVVRFAGVLLCVCMCVSVCVCRPVTCSSSPVATTRPR